MYCHRKDMGNLTTDQLFAGLDWSLRAQRVVLKSLDFPRGSVRLMIQTDNFLDVLMSRVVYR